MGRKEDAVNFEKASNTVNELRKAGLTPTLSNEQAVKAALDAYNKSTEAQKAK